MRTQLLKCIAVLFSMPLVGFSLKGADQDVTNFLAWLDKNAATECGAATLLDNCKAGTNPVEDQEISGPGAWDEMCDAAYTTVTCDNLPKSGAENKDGTELYNDFKSCCNNCATVTACCAECPGPIDYLLYWAENKAPPADSCEKATLETECGEAIETTALGTLGHTKDRAEAYTNEYKDMCTELTDNVGCTGLDDPTDPHYKTFQECATACKTEATVDKQMGCVKTKNCGYIAPTTHTGQTTAKQTTAGPAPPAPPPAPTTTTTVIPKTTTEGEELGTNSTESDTSSPLLPPTAIWAKVIALTAMIAKLL